MTVKTSNYVTTEDYTFHRSVTSVSVLPAGSFVRPIKEDCVPSHVYEYLKIVTVNSKLHTFAYTRYGILLLPISIIRET